MHQCASSSIGTSSLSGDVPCTRFHEILVLGVVLVQILDGCENQITSYTLRGLTQAFNFTFWCVPAVLALFIPLFGLRGRLKDRSLEVTAEEVARAPSHHQ